MEQKELFDAIRKGDATAVAALVDADRSLLSARENGVTPILAAIYHGQAELAVLFRERNATLTFGEACALGDLPLVLSMLERDATLLNANTEDGFPPLGLACFFRHPELARALIDRGAGVSAAADNALRVAPVHATAAVRDIATMQRLLDHGANVNARQQMGYTALHTAAQLGDVEMVELLLSHGADPRIAGDDGRTPTDLATAAGNTEIAKRLAGKA
jgi:ankyrin repeat protein